ncbi:MAG: hypothetical protein WCG35_03770 [Betaproteobacteria bacterium]
MLGARQLSRSMPMSMDSVTNSQILPIMPILKSADASMKALNMLFN